jgi:uncharacterized membrane protein YidH (DUF202 family)
MTPEIEGDEDLERTDLAWDRSALAIAVIGLLVLKQVLRVRTGHPFAVGVLEIILAGAVALMGFAYRRHRSRVSFPTRPGLEMVAVATAFVGVAALVLAAVSLRIV